MNNKSPEPIEAERGRLAERLRAAREYLGFSQDEVAKFLGIPRSALSNVECGQRKVDALELKRLAHLYKRSVAYFTGEEQQQVSSDVAHLARTASKLAPKDQDELARFADFLLSRKRAPSEE